MPRLRKPIFSNNMQRHLFLYATFALSMSLFTLYDLLQTRSTLGELQARVSLLFLWGTLLMIHAAWNRLMLHRLLQARKFAVLHALNDDERAYLHDLLIYDRHDDSYGHVRLVGDDGEFITQDS